MRDIKYRMWYKSKSEMLDVEMIDFKNKHYYMENYDKWLRSYLYEDEIELMQYTGLKDKNGKEIYEGDIVLYRDWEMAYEGGGNDSFINKGMVEYCEDNCCFNVTERQTIDISDVLYKDNEDLEVIGNIYDNPELLEGK